MFCCWFHFILVNFCPPSIRVAKEFGEMNGWDLALRRKFLRRRRKNVLVVVVALSPNTKRERKEFFLHTHVNTYERSGVVVLVRQIKIRRVWDINSGSEKESSHFNQTFSADGFLSSL